MTYAATIESVREAARRIAPYAHRTPVMTCAAIDAMAGRRVVFKCEIFQKVGAFKFRGACNAVMSLTESDAGRAVVTHSSGNHAQALALAARMRGIAAHIVMPNNASPVKVRAVEGYGGIVHLCEPTLEARESTASRIMHETGGVMIPPYNHPDIIAGQGTAALELLEQIPVLDAIITPVGGGGLLAGTCIAVCSPLPPGERLGVRGVLWTAHARSNQPSPTPGNGRGRIRIFGAEPRGADDAARSLAAGELIPQTNPRTIADGLLTSLGPLTFAIIRDHVERIITVSEDEIIRAMRLVWERMKVIIEPSAAVAVAAVLTDEFRALPGITRVGVILSGGNVDLDRLPWAK